MKKILITIGLMLCFISSSYSNETKCTDFKKFSKEYLKCKTDKIKKGTINKANEIKEGTAKKTSDLKKGVMKLTVKAKSKLKKSE
ncbi:hypothetical protein [Candidatus Pelagibacter bacterium nBUS_28]|jgi:hypothetical protein|uniref:hypothetical protein n=1 Tax=Candidatus Pelagibacter bacterium nBUS_28 TaxID=3374189 RepID=UPI003EC09C08|tara:strand:- start:423 stop:677 length:255 start_codon:yes stop_codon:yes gene_type:complete